MARRHLEDGRGLFSPAFNFVKRYVGSKAFKRRADAISPTLYDSANKQLENVKIYDEADFDSDVDGSAQYNSGDEHLIYMDPESRYPYNNSLAHELGHAVDNNRTKWWLPKQYEVLFNKQNVDANYRVPLKNGEFRETSINNDHDVKPWEKYADVMEARYDLFNRGIYDSTQNKPFKKKHYKKYVKALKKDGLLNQNRLIQGFDRDTYIDMMNTIAMNEPYRNYNNYAKYGARVKAENGVTILPEITVTPERKLKSSEKRRIARRELAKQRLLSEIAPDIASILYYPYNII